MAKTLMAAVAGQRCTVDSDEVLGALWRALHGVAQRALAIDLKWSTFAIKRIEDVPSRASDT